VYADLGGVSVSQPTHLSQPLGLDALTLRPAKSSVAVHLV